MRSLPSIRSISLRLADIVAGERSYLWLLALFVLGFGTFAAGMNIAYYADDFQFLFADPGSKVWWFLTHLNPNNHFYRPIQSVFLAFTQAQVGANTLPIHLIQLLLHIGLSYLVFVVMLKLQFSSVEALLGSAFMLLSQANVHAVLSNDTLSQVGGTLFGTLSVWWLYEALTEAERRRATLRFAGSVAAFLISILFKESSVSFFLIVNMLLLARSARFGPVTAARTLLLRGMPYVLALGAYLVARLLIGAEFVAPSGTYQFQFGLNMFTNLYLFTLALFVPVSSAHLYVQTMEGQIAAIVVNSVIIALLFAAVCYGAAQHGKRRVLLALTLAAVVALFPMVMLAKVSELYVYNAMPFFAVVFSAGLIQSLKLITQAPALRLAGILLVVLLLASHVLAIQSKTALMVENGRRAGVMKEQVLSVIAQVPQGGRLVLLNPDEGRIEYSIFYMNPFNVLQFGKHHLYNLSGRTDFGMRIINAAEPEAATIEPGDTVFTISEGRVVRWR